jgi:hypothetical protein
MMTYLHASRAVQRAHDFLAVIRAEVTPHACWRFWCSHSTAPACRRRIAAPDSPGRPLATFQVAPGDDPTGTYVLATVDVADTELVMDAYMDRLLTLQIDEGLPLYVLPFAQGWAR